jgi:hypothetical protein
VAAKIRHFSHTARKKLQKLSFFYFWKCFPLIFNDITKSGCNKSNKYLLNELKNRIFARAYPPSPLQGGNEGGERAKDFTGYENTNFKIDNARLPVGMFWL